MTFTAPLIFPFGKIQSNWVLLKALYSPLKGEFRYFPMLLFLSDYWEQHFLYSKV